MSPPYVVGLNPEQLRAVKHPPGCPLQILAGPGSGKTKVLTSRIAHFIGHHLIQPSSICAVTFTNKAANEMRERLTKLIGKDKTDQVTMETFHALCAKLLRKQGRLVGVEGNFTVCSTEESKKIIAKLLKPYGSQLAAQNESLNEGTVLSCISKAKSKGLTPDALLESCTTRQQKSRTKQLINEQSKTPAKSTDEIVAEVYDEYQRTLRDHNSLDFDDLLMFGEKLLRNHPKVGKWCTHVLVDEFQDTNCMQYEIMKHLASASQCVTVVGDPDQSIYGWRSADVENLAKMQKDFPSTAQILLEQNYRSTGSILAASVAIISQDKSRLRKSLHTTHEPGLLPVLQYFSSETFEASAIALEIKKLIACTGGMLNWSDFAILLRFNSASRVIERALQREGIPNRVLGGHKFFDRAEVKDLLAYLQLIDNRHFAPAFTRCINVPGRRIGEKTISEIVSRAGLLNVSPLDVVEGIFDGTMPDVKPAIKHKVKSFVTAIRILGDRAKEGASAAELIRELLDLVEYREYLEKTQSDWESRWRNMEELVNFASEVAFRAEAEYSGGAEIDPGLEVEWADDSVDFDHDALDDLGFAEVRPKPDVKGKGVANHSGAESEANTPLRFFLQASMLSTDTQAQGDDAGQEKVTITTCHTAKGLEWPVVFVPAVEQGTFPSARAEDIEEERRLLYVACTRAQGLLYLTYTTSRMVAGEVRGQALSNFITGLHNKEALFSNQPPDITNHQRSLLAKVLNRPLPDEQAVAKRVNTYNRGSNLAVESMQGRSAFTDSMDVDAGPSHEFGTSLRGFVSAKESLQVQQPRAPSANRTAVIPLSPSRNRIINSVPHSPSEVLPPIGAPFASENALHRAQAINPFGAGCMVKPSAPPARVRTRNTNEASVPQHPMPPAPDLHADIASASGPDEQAFVSPAAAQFGGSKRRLGMGRTLVGYSNKKFKKPT